MPRVNGYWPGKAEIRLIGRAVPVARRVQRLDLDAGAIDHAPVDADLLRIVRAPPRIVVIEAGQNKLNGFLSHRVHSLSSASRAIPRSSRERRDMVDDLIARGAGTKYRADSRRQQRRLLVSRHDAAHDDPDMGKSRLPQRLDELRHNEMIRGQRADAERIHVLFGSKLHDGGDRLPGRRIDHVHAGVSQEGRHDAAARDRGRRVRSW